MPETVVHLVRHGQVENPRRVLYGRLPGYHLSRRGQAQAELLAGYFADAPLAAVVASPLERAQQTATPIAAAHGLEVRTDLRLIETSNIFEGVAGNVAYGATSTCKGIHADAATTNSCDKKTLTGAMALPIDPPAPVTRTLSAETSKLL